MLKKNLDTVLNEIKNGNNLNEKITLVGATKMVDPDVINSAINMGLKVVAENKVQEFRLKTDLLIDCEQHFIGHLQTNKVKYLVGKVSLIQSVDSIHLAKAIHNEAVKKQVVQDILIEVNIGGELSKSGFSFDNAIEGINEIIKSFNGVKVVGLMAMLPHTEDEELLISLCEKMRSLYDSLNENGLGLKYLSMGMSEDYLIAINHGSNMIRLGSKLFGKRNYGV